MSRNKHPDKDIEAALAHAEANGWRVDSPRSHWGIMYCPFNDGSCGCADYCKTSIWSTQRDPATHARQLRKVVDRCTSARKIALAKSAGDDS